MFFDEFITKEITNLTSDDSTQSMFMLHRYLLCSYAICTYILRGEKDSSLIKDAKSCLDNLKVAVAYLDNLLEDSVSDSKKEQTKLKNAFDET